jgi:hypothetical protein
MYPEWQSNKSQKYMYGYYPGLQLLSFLYMFCFYFSLLLQLRSGGAQILEGCIAEIPNISSLDISDNGEARVDTVFTVIVNIVYLDFDLMLCFIFNAQVWIQT